MKRYNYILLLLIVTVTSSSCNSDIFVENDDLPAVVDITIEGDGGQWSTPISRKGLTAVYLNPSSSSSRIYYKYYDRNGKPADADTPISEIGSIEYENPCQYYAIGFNGDMGYITSYYNASGPYYFSVQLEYDYGVTKFINITVTEGKPLELQYCHMSGDLNIEDNIDKVIHKISFTNNSSIEQYYSFMPFESAKCENLVSPEDEWAQGLTFNLPMPVFNEDDWNTKVCPEVVIGHRRMMTSPLHSEEVKVLVPASRKASVTYVVFYSRATQNERLDLYNKEFNGYYEENVKCVAVYPTSCSYEVIYE